MKVISIKESIRWQVKKAANWELTRFSSI